MRARHALFIGLHLAPSLLALCVVPVRLACGVAAPWEFVAVLLLQAPLAAALLLSRGGSLRIAQGVSAGGLIGFGCLLAAAAPSLEPVAYAVFVVALFEAASAFDLRFGASSAVGVLAALAVIPVLRETLNLPVRGEANDPVLQALTLVPVLVYAGALAWGGARLERVRGRRAAQEEAGHQALARAIGDLVLHVDRRGVVLSCSDDAERLFALTSRDFSGRGFYERIHLADRPAFLQAISDSFEDRAAPVVILRLRTATMHSTRGDFQEPVHVSIEMRTRRLGDAARGGAREAAVCLIRDITAQKNREDEVRAAQRIAERAEQTRERFLANVSHELRTPLNAIIGFADLLQMEKVRKDEAKRAEYAAIISASGQHLLSVVNSILDVSKLEAGSFDLEATPFEPAGLLDGCLDIVRLKAADSGVALLRDYDSGLASIVGDERACRQIVINLLSNAVKFTPRGGVVTLSARSDFGLTITVEDTGIGIASGDMARLGDAFFQASNARCRTYEGTGLGLSLVRGLVGLHGGAMDVSSTPGAGTTVTVRLPQDCRADTPARTPVVIRTISRLPCTTVRSEKVKNIA